MEKSRSGRMVHSGAGWVRRPDSVNRPRPLDTYDQGVMTTSLMVASGDGDVEAVKRLLATPGIDVNEACEYGTTPLSWASGKSDAEAWKLTLVVKELLGVPGIDVNKADGMGATPLYWACGRGRHEVVKLLLAAPGIDVNQADDQGATPLYRASQGNLTGHVEVVRALLAAPGVDVTMAADDGTTPLSVARTPDIIRLLQSGA